MTSPKPKRAIREKSTPSPRGGPFPCPCCGELLSQPDGYRCARMTLVERAAKRLPK